MKKMNSSNYQGRTAKDQKTCRHCRCEEEVSSKAITEEKQSKHYLWNNFKHCNTNHFDSNSIPLIQILYQGVQKTRKQHMPFQSY